MYRGVYESFMKSSLKSSLKTLKSFDNIAISTKTIIVITNWELDINKLYEHLPITPYVFIPKKRGRKTQSLDKGHMENTLNDGDIITVKHKSQVRGIELKKKKTIAPGANERGKFYFLNCTSVVMFIIDKFVNFKIHNNGKFQVTGCKDDIHAEECIKHIWIHIQKLHSSIGDVCKITSEIPKAIFKTAMINVDFNIGFRIHRENLDSWINSYTNYQSLLETSFGYTGVNIKMECGEPTDQLFLCLEFDEDNVNNVEESLVKNIEYLNMLNDKDKSKELKKKKFHTFLVFHSGNIILSSRFLNEMEKVYHKFVDIMMSHKDLFEERLL